MGIFPQVGVNIKNNWNHHPVWFYSHNSNFDFQNHHLKKLLGANHHYLDGNAFARTMKSTENDHP